MLSYEMYRMCRLQREMGIRHPLAFGIYWTAGRFFLFCMDVDGVKYKAHQLLQFSSTESTTAC
jgi:hypothetical protein